MLDKQTQGRDGTREEEEGEIEEENGKVKGSEIKVMPCIGMGFR